MAQGGARPRSGPPPDPNALRRERDAGDWVHLPAAGRQGDPPPWPLTKATATESRLWAREWARPQAIEWERLGLEQDVAIYVRTLVAAGQRGAPVTILQALMRQEESLGISVPGMARNRWVIDRDDSHDQGRRTDQPTSSVVSIRERLRALGE